VPTQLLALFIDDSDTREVYAFMLGGRFPVDAVLTKRARSIASRLGGSFVVPMPVARDEAQASAFTRESS
jgi:hypothetical protein